MPRFLSRLPYGAKTSPVEEFDFEEDTGAADHSRYTWANAAYAMAVNINRSFKLYGWCSRIRGIESGGVGRRAADAHLPDRRRRRGHEVSDRDRHQRPARGGAGEERLHAARAPQELGLRRVHRRAVAAEAVRIRRSRRDGQRQSGGAAAVSVRVLPVRALLEVHRARQDRLVQGAGGHAGLAAEVDHELRRRRSGAFLGNDQGAEAAGGRRSAGGGSRRQSRATTRRSSSFARTISWKG